MAAIYLLDSGPLGLLAHNRPALRTPIQNWVLQEMTAGGIIYIPEVADYEVRRELTRLIRAGQLPPSRLQRLDQLASLCALLPVTTSMWMNTDQHIYSNHTLHRVRARAQPGCPHWTVAVEKPFRTSDIHATRTKSGTLSYDHLLHQLAG